MRAPPFLVGSILLAVVLAGCLEEEPVSGPDAATAKALVPPHELLGQPATWGAALGQGARAPQGEPRLVMAFAVETSNPNASRLVDGLYNMREHVAVDPDLGDGSAPHWLYQHRDDSTIAMQRVASSDGRSDGAAWGAFWDWSYWGLASPERPVEEWSVDSDAAADVARDQIEGWGDASRDHAYLLYVPAGLEEAHWLLISWEPNGSIREHAVVRATDGEVVPFDEVHPDIPERGAVSGVLVEGANPEETHRVAPEGNRSRIVLTATPEPASPLTDVTVEVASEGWQELERTTTAEGAQIVVLQSLGGGPVDVTIGPTGPSARYTLGWCAEGQFNDIFGRTPTACDP